MPSLKTSSAVRIARSLQPAERTINAAAADVLTLGAEMFRARASGAFGPLEGQDAVNKIGRATSMILDAMNEMADAHSSLREIAAGHQILSYGDLCPPPAADEPLATEKVQPIRVAA